MKDDKLSHLIELMEISIQQKSGSDSDIKSSFKVMQEHIKGIDDKIGEILDQTKRTNGNVMSLKMWRSLTVGGMTIISIIVLPLLIWIFQTSITMLTGKIDKVDASVEKHITNTTIIQTK